MVGVHVVITSSCGYEPLDYASFKLCILHTAHMHSVCVSDGMLESAVSWVGILHVHSCLEAVEDSRYMRRNISNLLYIPT